MRGARAWAVVLLGAAALAAAAPPIDEKAVTGPGRTFLIGGLQALMERKDAEAVAQFRLCAQAAGGPHIKDCEGWVRTFSKSDDKPDPPAATGAFTVGVAAFRRRDLPAAFGSWRTCANAGDEVLIGRRCLVLLSELLIPLMKPELGGWPTEDGTSDVALQAEVAETRGDHELALRLWADCARRKPKYAPQLNECLVRSGQAAVPVSAAGLPAPAPAGSAEAWFKTALLAVMDGQHAKALKLFKRCEKSPDARARDCAMYADMFGAHRGTKKSPATAVEALRAGSAAYRRGKYMEADRLWHVCLKAGGNDPASPAVQDCLTLVTELTMPLKSRPLAQESPARAIYMDGFNHYVRGDREGARAAWQRCAEADTDCAAGLAKLRAEKP